MLRNLVLVSALAACSSGSSHEQLTLENLDDQSKVVIELDVPNEWKSRTNNSFKSRNAFLGFAAMSPSGDAAERMDKAIAMQFGGTLVKQEQLANGKVWISLAEPGNKIHSRLFVPYSRGVVMAYAMSNPKEPGEVATYRKVFESIVVVEK